MLDVSVVVCTKNAEATIALCLESVIRNDPREIIIVDGMSTDRTFEIARFYGSVLFDEGKGLAHARNVGLDAATSRYICYVGPDNVLEPGTLAAMIAHMESRGDVGISLQTHLFQPKSFLAKSMDRYKRIRFTSGRRSIIGTPYLWSRPILSRYRYTEGLTSSDDTDLCERVSKDGYSVAIAPLNTWEIGTTTLADIKRRWLWYGNSDYEFWCKYSKHWTWRRKLKSLLHPLTADLLGPVRKDLRLAPFCLMITGLRYWGWLRAARRG